MLFRLIPHFALSLRFSFPDRHPWFKAFSGQPKRPRCRGQTQPRPAIVSLPLFSQGWYQSYILSAGNWISKFDLTIHAWACLPSKGCLFHSTDQLVPGPGRWQSRNLLSTQSPPANIFPSDYGVCSAVPSVRASILIVLGVDMKHPKCPCHPVSCAAVWQLVWVS